jgi:mannose-6-phosphate isomerase-like protein (cupin superfamily)
MPLLTTGRRLDQNGRPIDGTGFTYDSEGPLAALLAQRTSPLLSQPVTGEYVFQLVTPQATGGAYERGAGIFPPGNKGPAEHFHRLYDEYFEFVQGEFLFSLGGQERKVGPGEKLVATKGTPHCFRCVGDQMGAVVVETRPAATIGPIISTLFGMAHEGLLTPQGQPKFLHAMVIAAEYPDDTVFTSPPPGVVLPLAKALAPLGRRLGYQAGNDKYLAPAFWAAHVEQP